MHYMLEVFHIPQRIAAPGHSNHQSGIAIDFQQVRVRSAPVVNSTSPSAVARWRRTWFFTWLLSRASTYGFEPYEREAWHWEFRAPGSRRETAPAASSSEVQDQDSGVRMLQEAEGLFDSALAAYRRARAVLGAPATGGCPPFAQMWANHPAAQPTPDLSPCRDDSGNVTFGNQCVIRLGLALTRSEVSLDSYDGAFCWFGHGRTHPLRVEEMKVWLNEVATGFTGRAEISRVHGGFQKDHTAYAGRSGIAAFLDFWGPGNQGDHIDLWNGSRMTHGDNSYFARSREIWFWPC